MLGFSIPAGQTRKVTGALTAEKYFRKRKFPFSIKWFFIEVTFSKVLLEMKKELEGNEILVSTVEKGF